MEFGFADLFGDPSCSELGYTLLSELESVRGPGGLKIERDLWFPPTTLAEVMRQHGKYPSLGPARRGLFCWCV